MTGFSGRSLDPVVVIPRSYSFLALVIPSGNCFLLPGISAASFAYILREGASSTRNSLYVWQEDLQPGRGKRFSMRDMVKVNKRAFPNALALLLAAVCVPAVAQSGGGSSADDDSSSNIQSV